jgi:protein-tyrosine phosphatase
MRSRSDVNTEAVPLIPGTFNSRDVGGRPATGGPVRRGMLIRSDAPAALGREGQAVLRELGIRTLLDLRQPLEQSLDPVDLDGLTAHVRRVPILGDDFDLAAHRSMGLSEIYIDLLERRAAQLVAAIRVLSDPAALPVVVFCSAGKDRTGVLVALVLNAIGVDDGGVVDDYTLTARRTGADYRATIEARAVAAGLTEQELAVKLGAPPEVIVAALDWVRERYGSVADYLLAAGLTPRELDDLRRALVDSDVTSSNP